MSSYRKDSPNDPHLDDTLIIKNDDEYVGTTGGESLYIRLTSGIVIESHMQIQNQEFDTGKHTKVRPESPWTGIGCDLGWVSPVPSCPYSLLPHAHNAPSSWRAKL